MMAAADRTNEASRHLPLSPRVFQILISLADGPRHGYAVIQEIAERTDGEIRLTASTLYDALTRLVDQEWIEEVPAPADADGHDSRRRYYRLSEFGREVARREALRLEQVLESAREKRLLPERERARK
jgi:DNA-binding PadR family transcriptional regulator